MPFAFQLQFLNSIILYLCQILCPSTWLGSSKRFYFFFFFLHQNVKNILPVRSSLRAQGYRAKKQPLHFIDKKTGAQRFGDLSKVIHPHLDKPVLEPKLTGSKFRAL